MSVKQIVLITAASVAVLASATFAGGVTAAPGVSDSGVYIDVAVGGALRDVKDDSSLTASTGTPTYSNGSGGFTFGADVGYQFNKTWAVEIGYQWMADAKVTALGESTVFVGGIAQTLTTADVITVKTWMMNAALKGSMPVMDSVSAFAKIGAAYTHNQVSALDGSEPATFKQDTSYWNPMFAVGLAYHVDSNWNVALQYSFVPGGDTWAKVQADPIIVASDAGAHHFPGIHSVTVSAGYMFAL